MQIIWTKGSDKEDTLTCVRADGSRTYMRVAAFFPLHDLLHYAVETSFGFSHAFWGLIAGGWSLDDFSAKDLVSGNVALAVPVEAMIAENIVGFLSSVETGSLASEPQAPYKIFHEFLEETNIPVPANRTPERFADTRIHFAERKARWEAFPPGDTLEVTFP